jgi:hypothetical protein
MVASISFPWLSDFCVFFGYFVGFSCAACSFDPEAFVFGFVCGDHG